MPLTPAPPQVRGNPSQQLNQLRLRGKVARFLRDGHLPQPAQPTGLLQKFPKGDQHPMFGVRDWPDRRAFAHRHFLRLQAYRGSVWACEIASDSTLCALVAQNLR
jgi:hypothetical protein